MRQAGMGALERIVRPERVTPEYRDLLSTLLAGGAGHDR